MGISIEALIEYDDECDRSVNPFLWKHQKVIDLTGFLPFVNSKDQAFLDICVSWPSSESSLPHRGLPPTSSRQAIEKMEDCESISWSTYDELNKAMRDKGVSKASLSLAANIVLDMLEFLAGEIGGDRVRIIVGID